MPEWKYVPSPRFWNTWRVLVNIECDAQSTPSPPIWIKPVVSRSIHDAMKWQPMPACATEPSGTFVDVLCGQPEQKYGVRFTESATFDRICGATRSTTFSRRSSAGL